MFQSSRVLIAIGVLMAALVAPPSTVLAVDIGNGEYIFHASGCGNCHTDPGKKGEDGRPKGEALAGGHPLKTPFGIFYTPNITPHPEAGIGRWSFEDFRRAMIDGKAPNSAPYYPAFPYTSYTGMTDSDLSDLWAFLQSQKPSARVNDAHDLKFPFNLRLLMHGWRFLFFESGGTDIQNSTKPADWKRGAYIARALGHCGECHTPRNALGAMEMASELAGNPVGPGGKIPDLTPRNTKGIASWSKNDIIEYLRSGMTAEGDFAGGEMAKVIDHSTSKLTDSDRAAVATFLKALQ
jgi:mono/diheme cytochrome c family protein